MSESYLNGLKNVRLFNTSVATAATKIPDKLGFGFARFEAKEPHLFG
jgi:hypothetical protein